MRSSAEPRGSVATLRAASLAFLCDAALVLIFAGLGRSSHERDATVFGLLQTAWPFLAGLVLSWVVFRAWRRPRAIPRTGVPLWLGSVVVGMLLRWVSGAGTALPFILVATGTLGAFLLGWRLVATLVHRLRIRRAN